MDTYMKSVPADKIIPEDYSYQGRILAWAGKPDEGIAVLNKAIAAQPDPAKQAELQDALGDIDIYLLDQILKGRIT